jgi:hypothetical protein
MLKRFAIHRAITVGSGYANEKRRTLGGSSFSIVAAVVDGSLALLLNCESGTSLLDRPGFRGVSPARHLSAGPVKRGDGLRQACPPRPTPDSIDSIYSVELEVAPLRLLFVASNGQTLDPSQISVYLSNSYRDGEL